MGGGFIFQFSKVKSGLGSRRSAFSVRFTQVQHPVCQEMMPLAYEENVRADSVIAKGNFLAFAITNLFFVVDDDGVHEAQAAEREEIKRVSEPSGTDVRCQVQTPVQPLIKHLGNSVIPVVGSKVVVEAI